jgi:hypothetical protein
MRAARAAAAAAAAGCLLATACSAGTATQRPSAPEPDLRIWAPPVIHWSPGAERSVRFAVENVTQRTIEVGEADPRAARFAVFLDAGQAQACGVEPEDPSAAEAVKLQPGDQLPVRVDLGDACGGLSPGEYRYELSYRVAKRGGGTTSLQTRHGTVIVDGPPRAVGRRGPVEEGRPAARRP